MSIRECEGGCAGSVIISFLVGGLVGAGLALFLTPVSGPEARRRVREFKDTVEDRAGDFKEKAFDRAEHAMDEGKEYLRERKSMISSAIEAGKEAFEREKEHLRKGADA